MPIRIPPDAKVVPDSRLNLLAALKLLARTIEPLRDAIKSDLKKKKARYARSSLAEADLCDWQPRFIDPAKLHQLIPLDKFLACCRVSTEQAEKFLGRDVIASILLPAPKAGEGAGSLFCEFKPDLKLDADKLRKALLDGLKAQLG